MRYLFSLLLIISVNLQARDFESMITNDIFILEDFVHGNPKERSLLYNDINISNDIVEKSFNDHLNLVNIDFKTPAYFYNNAYFWFRIYAQYTSSQVVLHDKNHLNLIYTVLDYSDLKKTIDSPYTASNLQTYLTTQKAIEYKKILIELSNGCVKKECKQIEKIITNAKFIIPKKIIAKKIFYENLISNIRGQTGQRDRVYEGVMRFLPYDDFFTFYLKEFDLPYELSAIPFLESSFNFQAYSKVAARGIWQIMPYISNKIFPIHKDIDYRVSPIISTIGALHLLKQNKKIVKRWDLAVTAYNSGTKHLINASRQLKIPLAELSLDIIFEKYSHPHLGFASKNFYSEFLAISKVLDYKQSIYPIANSGENSKKNIYQLYLAKCALNGKALAQHVDSGLNLHLNLAQKAKFPKGLILASKTSLPSKYFYKMEPSFVVKAMPITWSKFLKNQSCSTK